MRTLIRIYSLLFLGLYFSHASPPPEVVGNQKWVAILCKFSDSPAVPSAYGKAHYINLFTNVPGINHYWAENSYGAMTMTGSTVVGWYTLPHPESYYIQGANDVKTDELFMDATAAADATINFNQYFGVNLFIYTDEHVALGTGDKGATLDGTTRTWGVTWMSYYHPLSTICHEMAHGYRLNHPETDDENYWGISGNTHDGIPRHVNAAYKDLLGWINHKKYYYSSGHQTYSINRIALPPNSQPVSVIVPLNINTTHYYTVEAKRYAGFYDSEDNLPAEGVLLYEMDTSEDNASYLIANPRTYPYGHWRPGDTFSNLEYGVQINVAAKTDSGYTVSVFKDTSSLHLSAFSTPGASISRAGYQIFGEKVAQYFGSAVVSLGDWDGDYADEFFVGAPGDSEPISSNAYIFLGGQLPSAQYEEQVLLAGQADILLPERTDVSFGVDAANAGDIDRDGLSDLLVGAPANSENESWSGAVYLYMASNLLKNVGAINTATQEHCRFLGEFEDAGLGDQALAGIGDVDGDHRGDILMGLPYGGASPHPEGVAYLWLGSNIMKRSGGVDVSMANYALVGEKTNDLAGYCVVGAGNMDGDELSDFLISAPGPYSSSGIVYLMCGATLRRQPEGIVDLSMSDLYFIGERNGNRLGTDIANAGDVDGDGLNDILMSVSSFQSSSNYIGKIYLFLGNSLLHRYGTNPMRQAASRTQPEYAPEWIIPVDYADYVWIGATNMRVGSARSAGDVDGDGLSDVLISASTTDALLFLGSTIKTSSWNIALSSASYILSDAAGIKTHADIDGNGFSDLLFAYIDNSENGHEAGKVTAVLSDLDCVDPTTIYVDGIDGSPENEGGPGCPVNTIARGIELALEYDVSQVVVRGGTYYEPLNLEYSLELRGETKIIDGAEWFPLIAPSNVAYAMSLDGADGAIIDNFRIAGNAQIRNCDSLTFSRNSITGTYGAFSLYNSHNSVFKNNVVIDTGKYTEGKGAVLIADTSSDNTFINNTIHRTRTGDIITLDINTYDNVFYNNILWAATISGTPLPASYGFYATAPATVIAKYNKTMSLNSGVSLDSTNKKGGNPGFEATFDYHLAPGSTCINAGDPNTIYNDMDGTRNDMGAYGGPTPLP